MSEKTKPELMQWDRAGGHYKHTEYQMREAIEPLQKRIVELEAQNTQLTASLETASSAVIVLKQQQREGWAQIASGQEPVAAQQRFRHPQKTMPDWSVWQPCGVSDMSPWRIDSQGYEVEYRSLYTRSAPAQRPLSDKRCKFAVQKSGLRSCQPDDWFIEGVRFAEAAHNIREKK
jgi:hypothetical protein